MDNESKEFAKWLTKNMLRNLPTYSTLNEVEIMQIEHILLSSFWAGLNYDKNINKIPEKVK